MQLFYNDFALHSLTPPGGLTIGGQDFEPLPDAEAPQRNRVTLRVKLHFLQSTYFENRSMFEEAHEALKTQQGVLRWVDDASGTEYLNQTVTLTSHNLPDDPNAVLDSHGQYDLVFQFFENDL